MAAETKTKNERRSFLGSIRTYLSEVRTELQKVSWPTRDEIISLTRIVLLVTAVTSIALGMLSIGLTFFFDQIGFEYPIILVVLFVVIAAGTWWMFRRDETKKY